MIHLKTNSKSQLACSHKGTERGSLLPLHQTGKFWAGLFHHTQVCLTTTLLWFTLVRGKIARKVSPSQEMSIKPGKKQGYNFMWLSFSKASGHMARAKHLRTPFPPSLPALTAGTLLGSHSQTLCFPDRILTATFPKITVGQTICHNQAPSARLLRICRAKLTGPLLWQLTDKLYLTGWCKADLSTVTYKLSWKFLLDNT